MKTEVQNSSVHNLKTIHYHFSAVLKLLDSEYSLTQDEKQAILKQLQNSLNTLRNEIQCIEGPRINS